MQLCNAVKPHAQVKAFPCSTWQSVMPGEGAANRRYSRVYQGKGELIDHILISKERPPGKPPQTPQVDAFHPEAGRLASVNDNSGDRAEQKVDFP